MSTPFWIRRFLLLLGLVLLVGFATGAIAQTPASDASFHLTRAQAVALIVSSDARMRQRAEWFQDHMPPLPLFKDTKQTDWFAPYLESAFEWGIVEGNPGRTFRPNDFLRTEEAAALAMRYKFRGDGELPVVLYMPGANAANQWYSTSLQSALSANITLPTPLVPGLPLTKGAYFAMLQSVGVQRPDQIALIDPPAPVYPVQVAAVPVQTGTYNPSVTPRPVAASRPVALQPVTTRPTTTPRPTTTAPRPTTTTTTPRPTTTTPRPTTPTPRPTTTQPTTQARATTFKISMPTLGIKDLLVSHPSDPFTSKGLLAVLQRGVGHLFSYPGTSGKILVYGHSSSYPWDVSEYTKIFRQINKLGIGDKVYVDYQGVTHVYQVTHKQTVPAKDLSAYRNGGGEELILYTCWPPDSITQRYLVHAKPVETVAQQ